VIGKVIMTRSKKYHAHVEGLEAVEGDLVQIEECAPISKTKAWRVAKVVGEGPHRLNVLRHKDIPRLIVVDNRVARC
jgi:hypothetical protein